MHNEAANCLYSAHFIDICSALYLSHTPLWFRSFPLSSCFHVFAIEMVYQFTLSIKVVLLYSLTGLIFDQLKNSDSKGDKENKQKTFYCSKN